MRYFKITGIFPLKSLLELVCVETAQVFYMTHTEARNLRVGQYIHA